MNRKTSKIGLKEVDYGTQKTLILVIIDGLGTELRYSKSFTESFQLGGEWISSTYPSITPTALSSIFTGLTPGQHGITGHLLPTFKTKSFHRISLDKNMNWHDYDFITDKGSFVNDGNLSHFKEPDLYILGPANPLHPSFGIIPMLTGKRIHSYLTTRDLGYKIRRIISRRKQPKVIIVYSMMYDIIAHLTGKTNVLAKREINVWSTFLNNMMKSLSSKDAEETTILISADHGHKEISNDIKLNRYKKEYIEDHIDGIGKSGRVLHFYPDYGYEDRIKRVLEDEWGEFGLVVDQMKINELIGGEAEEESIRRVGSLNFIPFDGYSPSWEAKYNWFNNIIQFPSKFLPTTEHGGLTKDELVTPFFVFDHN